MILYDYFCVNCDKTFERLSRPSENVVTHDCGHSAKRCPSFRGTISVFHDYFSESLGMRIHSATHERDEIKKVGGVKLHPGDTFNTRKKAKEMKEARNRQTQDSVKRYVQTEVAPRLMNEPVPRIRETIERERHIEAKERGDKPYVIKS